MLYSIRITVYRLETGRQLFALKLSMFSPFDEAAKRAGHRPEIATVTAIAAQYGVVIHPPKQECSDEICLRADGTFRRLGGFNLDSAPQFTSRIAHYLLKSLDFLSSCWLSGPRAWHHARTGLLRAGVYANPRSADGGRLHHISNSKGAP